MSWRDDPDYQRCEAKWRKSDDIRYAALELGRWYRRPVWPELPPNWALEACAEYYEKALVGLEPLIKSTQGGKPSPSDYAIINRVARLRMASSERTTYQCFKQILLEEQGLKGDHLASNLKRLMNYWGKESIHDGEVCNRHISRVARMDARARGAGREWNEIPEKK